MDGALGHLAQRTVEVEVEKALETKAVLQLSAASKTSGTSAPHDNYLVRWMLNNLDAPISHSPRKAPSIGPLCRARQLFGPALRRLCDFNVLVGRNRDGALAHEPMG